MSQLPLRISVQAEADLLDHYAYIGRDRPSAAERFFNAFEDGCERTASHPLIGTACSELAPHLTAIRRWPSPGFSNYLLFYREHGGRIEILRLVHGARDLDEALAASPITFDDEKA